MDLFLIFQIFVFHSCIYLGNWGVQGAMCQVLELLDQNPWRNNLSKLATFESILQRPHIAMSVLNVHLDRQCKIDFMDKTIGTPIQSWKKVGT